MFLAMGVGAYGAGIFHLYTHAFFKALLFLGSGAVIHALSGEQDMRKMGGLKKYMPVTYWTFWLGTVAIAGIPPLAGFFSKLYVFMAAINAGLIPLAVIGVLASVVGAFYYLRIVKLMYFDEPAEDAVPVGGSALMRVVLSANALAVMVIGIVPGALLQICKLAIQ
jgi:NADH-quinone oxidoreductase subunit L